MFGNVKTKINTIQKSWIKNNNKGKEPRSRKNLPLEPEFACLPGETQTFESPMQGSYEPHLNGGQHWVMCSKGYLFLSSNNIKPRILTSRPQALLHQVKLHFSRAECTKQANLTPINDFQASAKEDRTPLSLTHTQQIIPVTKI